MYWFAFHGHMKSGNIEKMRILHISTSDMDGGAARAAYRLHKGLKEIGVDSSMFVARRTSQEEDINLFQWKSGPKLGLKRRLIRRRVEKDYAAYASTRPPGLEPFSDDRTDKGEMVDQLPVCDVINLHWVSGLVDYTSFFARVPSYIPVVWTLHDMNAFTGGCHYDNGCPKYVSGCGACPQLGSSSLKDLSQRIWERKNLAFRDIPQTAMHMVGPSQWLADEACRSPFLGRFDVSVIPYGLNLSEFAPRNQKFAREVLGIPQNAAVVLFGAAGLNNSRKGLSYLLAALEKIKDIPNILLCSVGMGNIETPLNLPCIHLGNIQNDRMLSLIYSAADIFTIPSVQDNLPNTVMEALACGIPTIGFNIGGIPDMVRPGQTGMLVPPKDANSLSKAITELLQNSALRRQMAFNCRQVAEAEYPLALQAQRYTALYGELIAHRK